VGSVRTRIVELARSVMGDELLPTVLSVTAGSADVISFLGLGGLFVAHITGNLVLLAATWSPGHGWAWRCCCRCPCSSWCWG
jgi:uncharacterized membrane protein YoaK (UPF0700 family)